MKTTTELLHTCPTCNTPNFTARGLKAHRCNGIDRSVALPVGAPDMGTSEQIVVATGQVSDDAVMGAQLTEQYHRAVGAMTEILRFGAMMMMLQQNHSTRGVVSGGRGKKGGLNEWLRTYAPEVKQSTAYRFMNVALAVSEKFELPKKVSFIDLASKPADELPKKLQKKQLELWDFVNGTSQRSWLDQFTPKGGHRERPNGTTRRTKAEKEFDDKFARARDWYRFGFTGIKLAHEDPENTWLHLDDQNLANLADLLKCFTKVVDEVCRSRKVVPSKLANWHLNEEQI